jgi:hypothetical protein
VTTEAGGGVPSGELRDVLMEEFLPICQMAYAGSGREMHEMCALSLTKGVMANVKDAGFEIQPTERMDRLRSAAGRDDAMNMAWRSLLKPGDLDRPGGRE